MPTTEPDRVLEVPTLPQQALLYQLCGESNLLHSDPVHAERAGFAQPILQGVCTYGMVGKAIVDVLLDADPRRVVRCSTRFAGVVFPGETLRVQVWQHRDGVSFIASTVERPDWPVLTHGFLGVKQSGQ